MLPYFTVRNFCRRSNNQKSTEIERPKDPFLNDIKNFKREKLKKTEKVEKDEVKDPFADALRKRVPFLNKDNREGDNNNDDDKDWDD